MEKISVIIPVYNVAEVLDRCLDSVLNQTYKNLEILLVDDGSTDSSGQLCDRYAENDARVRVIHKINQGLGMARNTGLKYAGGDYISFVDSDDYLEKTAYEQLVRYINDNSGDICFFGHFRVQGGKAKPYDVPPSKTIYCGMEESLGQLFNDALLGKPQNGVGFTGLSVCAALYKKELIVSNRLRFLSEREILSEDVFFNLEACAVAKTVCVYPEYLYYYVFRTSSLTTCYKEDRFKDALRMDKALGEAADAHGAHELLKQGRENCLCMNLIVCLKQELIFEKQIGREAVMTHIREMGSCDRVRECLCSDAFQIGLGRKLIAKNLKWRRWKWVYLIIKTRLWVERFRACFR